MGWHMGVAGAGLALVSAAGAAQNRPATASRLAGSEIAAGVFEHGANFHPLGDKLIFDLPALPAGQIYEGEEENGTVDVQLAFRAAPLAILLRPRLTAKVQVSTAGRTSFASVGTEWRQHALRRRLYGQAGFGLTVHDGYRFTPDPFEPGLSAATAQRRFAVYRRRTSFGSQVLFNPNASIGVRLDPRWAVEVAWEHFSHRQLFSDQNPGIDHVGIRLVRTLAR